MTVARRVEVVAAGSLAGAVADWVVARVSEAVSVRGSCALALSGGHTPRPVYEALAAPPRAGAVDWARVEVFFGDERAVAPDAPESNYRMVREALLDRVPLAPARLHRMPADRADLDGACLEYERLLPERFDVLLLGMGDDGHTASLFPRSPALDERHRRIVGVEAPVAPRRRMTVTPPVIAAARAVAVVVSGAAKAEMVARALRGPLTPREVPVQLAVGARWFVDEPAASALGAERGAR